MLRGKTIYSENNRALWKVNGEVILYEFYWLAPHCSGSHLHVRFRLNDKVAGSEWCRNRICCLNVPIHMDQHYKIDCINLYEIACVNSSKMPASTFSNRLRQQLKIACVNILKKFFVISDVAAFHMNVRERERERKKEGERKKERERNKRNNKIKRKVWKSRERKISAQSYEHFTIINYDSGVVITGKLFIIYARRGLIRLATGEKERTEVHNIKKRKNRTEEKRERDRTKDHCKW